MMHKPLTIGLLPVLVLVGCTMEPDYQRPSLPVDSSFVQQGPHLAGNGADIRWQNFFTEPMMHQLISLALKNNRDLRVAALNVEVARSQVTVSRSALFPSVDLNAGETAAHMPGNLYNTRPGGGVTYHQFDANFGVTAWELDFFGRLRSMSHSALERYLAMDATQRAARISLISQVAVSYLSLCADNELLHLASDTAESQQKSYDLTKRSYDGGVSSEQDLVQAETLVRTAQADVATYSRQVRQDTNALMLLVGRDLPASLLANASVQKTWHFPATPAGLPSDLLTNRPDIIAAEHTLKAANANIGAARAAFFPSISLTAMGGSTSGRLSDLLSGGTAAWAVSPSLDLPVFRGGQNVANLNIAKLQKRIEIADYEKTIQTAFKEVGDALAGQETYQDELNARQLDELASQKNYDLANVRYREGVDNFLNVLVAQRSLYSAQQLLITTRLGQLTQQVMLYKALGGGWKS